MLSTRNDHLPVCSLQREFDHPAVELAGFILQRLLAHISSLPVVEISNAMAGGKLAFKLRNFRIARLKISRRRTG
jgi:hypothetical protein